MSFSRPFTLGAGIEEREVRSVIDAVDSSRRINHRITVNEAGIEEREIRSVNEQTGTECCSGTCCHRTFCSESTSASGALKHSTGVVIGSRDPRYVDIEFSVKTDCKCGKYKGGCLAEALLDGHDYTRAYNVLQNLRFKVHQNGYNSKSQIKEALRPEFEDTIDGHTFCGTAGSTVAVVATVVVASSSGSA
jgi:hypothetical protein